MREVACTAVSAAVRQLCIDANHVLPADIAARIHACRAAEPWPLAQATLATIEENLAVAAQGVFPICQDTGMACVFIELGQEVHLTGGSLTDAVNEGVRQGYADGYLRKSIVDDPLFDRKNTGDNTPALIHLRLVPGDGLKITVAPKGFGSENMCQVRMLKPSDGVEGLRRFVLEAVEQAGPNPCPPLVIGVGVGGNFESVALLSKEAMLRPVEAAHPDPRYAALERELLDAVNALGIGPAGYGGQTTALSLHIASAPTHIAGMPAAVSICCHVARHKEATL